MNHRLVRQRNREAGMCTVPSRNDSGLPRSAATGCLPPCDYCDKESAVKGLALLCPIAGAIWLLDIDGHDLMDTAAALFVITATLLGLFVSTLLSALTRTSAFLVG